MKNISNILPPSRMRFMPTGKSDKASVYGVNSFMIIENVNSLTELKECLKCNVKKPISKFERIGGARLGVRNTCRSCRRTGWTGVKWSPSPCDLNSERWENINVGGVDTGYKISSIGRIILPNNEFANPFHDKKQGYIKIVLTVSGRRHTQMVHRLVAIAFLENPNKHKYVNHKNGDKTNPSYKNLEWVTQEQNIQHAYDTGLNKIRSGADNPNSRPVSQFSINGTHINDFASQTEAATILGLSQGCISYACKSKRGISHGFIFRFKNA